VGLLARIKALERDVAQAKRDRALLSRWEDELRASQSQLAHTDPSRPLPRDGVDYSFARPTGSELVKAGVTFVIRYVASGAGADLTHAEAQELSRAGLELGVVRESTPGRMLDGFAAGASDAKAARAFAHGCGMPPGRPVYYACDREVTGEALNAVREYVRGAVSATSWHEVGVYGSFEVVEHLHALNACGYFWQTLAWSQGQWSNHAQLRQIAIERMLGGARVDLDRAIAADFGQWRTA
jgi:hypothetical protein